MKHSQPIVVFRVDSSTQIGSGHLMRCLTLAEQVRRDTLFPVLFISRALPGTLSGLVTEYGYELELLPAVGPSPELTGYAQWLTVRQETDARQVIRVLEGRKVVLMVVDNYAIDKEWEEKLAPLVKRLLVIDDLSNRQHVCDYLLDQNFYPQMERRYRDLVPPECKLFLGPEYLLLREEFYLAREKMRVRNGHIHNILIFFGGSDLTNETMKVLQALYKLNADGLEFHVVVGGANIHAFEIEEYCKKKQHCYYYYQITYMAQLMHEADLAIGAGGTTGWERNFMGLPSLVTAIADNQVEGSRLAGVQGLCYYAGLAQDMKSEDYQKVLQEILQNRIEYCNIVEKLQNSFTAMKGRNFLDELGFWEGRRR